MRLPTPFHLQDPGVISSRGTSVTALLPCSAAFVSPDPSPTSERPSELAQPPVLPPAHPAGS